MQPLARNSIPQLRSALAPKKAPTPALIPLVLSIKSMFKPIRNARLAAATGK